MKLAVLSFLSILPQTSSKQVPFIQNAAPMDRLLSAMDTMQSQFFEPWLGTWPQGIDWTRAVFGTHISAGTLTYSDSLLNLSLADENTVNKYFSQVLAYYFGQDHLAIRLQAYDDILWVVLGWLDTTNLISRHSCAHFPSWYGSTYTAAFAHRARIFWELATAGWNETLCEGGMIWSPWLIPYKNAITNELFISASINMYLYFPGNNNDFPFTSQLPSKHDSIFLNAAIKAYNWLDHSNMTNSQGLYFDGFHTKDWTPESNGSSKCDVPNPMVYTYNQGVLLSGHRGLFLATGNTTYLTSGHSLIRNVIFATGFDLPTDTVTSPSWSGLGRNGILEDACDSASSCSQDSQTFKGIFFHHLTEFCQPLPMDTQHWPIHGADQVTAILHLQSCRGYSIWVERNARAAWATRDKNGTVGMWWTLGLGEGTDMAVADVQGEDYRNTGVLQGEIWDSRNRTDRSRFPVEPAAAAEAKDPNSRGRGRTVETHSGGVAVLRAHVEFQALYNYTM